MGALEGIQWLLPALKAMVDRRLRLLSLEENNLKINADFQAIEKLRKPANIVQKLEFVRAELTKSEKKIDSTNVSVEIYTDRYLQSQSRLQILDELYAKARKAHESSTDRSPSTLMKNTVVAANEEEVENWISKGCQQDLLIVLEELRKRQTSSQQIMVAATNELNLWLYPEQRALKLNIERSHNLEMALSELLEEMKPKTLGEDTNTTEVEGLALEPNAMFPHKHKSKKHKTYVALTENK